MKTLTSLCVLVLATTAQAEDRKPTSFPSVPFHVLLANEAVQETLKLSADQKKGVEEIAGEAKEALRGVNRLERAERMKKQADVRQKLDDKLGKLLKEEQLKRLTQIDYQQRGPLALSGKKVADEVDLTKEQRTEIRELSQKMNQEVAKLREGGTRGAELAEKSGKMRAEVGGKVAKLLNDEQKKKWTKLLGESFDISKITPGR